MSKSIATTTVSAATVRAWAVKKGLTVGTRGRLSPEVREAFAKAHRSKAYVVGTKDAKTVPVVVKVKGKPPVRKHVVIADVRAAADAAGIKVGARGRLSREVLQAYVTNSL